MPDQPDMILGTYHFVAFDGIACSNSKLQTCCEIASSWPSVTHMHIASRKRYEPTSALLLMRLKRTFLVSVKRFVICAITFGVWTCSILAATVQPTDGSGTAFTSESSNADGRRLAGGEVPRQFSARSGAESPLRQVRKLEPTTRIDLPPLSGGEVQTFLYSLASSRLIGIDSVDRRSLLPDNGHIQCRHALTCTLVVSSAEANRIQLTIRSLRSDISFQVGSVENDQWVTNGATYRFTRRDQLLGTATVDGGSIAVVFSSPTAIGNDDLRVDGVFHALDRAQIDTLTRSSAVGGVSPKSNVDACTSPAQCAPSGMAKAIGLRSVVLIHSNGGSCTATLINHSDDGKRIPYLLTAAHCMQSQDQADTLSVDYFYQTATCSGGGIDPNYTNIGGGADLLAVGVNIYGGRGYDYALLRLRNYPPDQGYLSVWAGWTTGPSVNLENYSHPTADLKRWSDNGGALAKVEYEVPFRLADNPLVNWISPIILTTQIKTSPGSSGSPLLTTWNGNSYVRGILSGQLGDYCQANQESDFTPFNDVVYTALRPWINPVKGMTIQPTSIDFGLIRKGTVHTKSVTITNTGEGYIQLDWLDLHPDITLTYYCSTLDLYPWPDSGAPPMLAPGASCQVELTWQPTSVYSLPTSLTAASNAPQSQAQIAVTGNAVSGDGGPYLYVSEEGAATIAVVNAQTRERVSTIEVGQQPYGVAITPAKNQLLVASAGENRVALIDTASETTSGYLYTDGTPIRVAITSSGNHAYVSSLNGNTVAKYDLKSRTRLATVPVGQSPVDIVLSSDELFGFVAAAGSGRIDVFSTSTGSVVTSIPVTGTPSGLVVSADGSTIFAGIRSPASIAVVNVATRSVARVISIPSTSGVASLALHPDQSKLYAALTDDGAVAIVDLSLNQYVGSIPVGIQPRGLAVDPLRGLLEVANSGSNSMSWIDLSLNQAVDSTPLNSFPYSISGGTYGVTGPDLTITNTHLGSFFVRQEPAIWTLTVRNEGSAPTSGMVHVSDVLPLGVWALSAIGDGWTCVIAHVPSRDQVGCTRTDPLPAGSSFPPIAVSTRLGFDIGRIVNVAYVEGGSDVLANNNVANDWTVVNALPDTNADLAALSLSAGQLNPAFNAAAIDYQVNVPNAASGVTVLAQTSNPAATMTANGLALASGVASAPIALAVGDTPISIVVTAQDGSTKKTYMVTVHRPPSLPLAATAGSANTTASTSSLHATVSSQGAPTNVAFEIGLTTAYGALAGADQSPLGGSAVNQDTSVSVSGMACNTTYHYRVVATNDAGTTYGVDKTLRTWACPPDKIWDAFWRNASGANAIWQFYGTGAAQFSASFPPGVPSTWQVRGVGDVNGDGVPDVVWLEPSSGQIAIWLMSGPGVIGAATFPASVGPASPWVLSAVGDVNGDGRADLVWRNASTGQTLAWLMNPSGMIGSTRSFGIVPLAFELVGIADINGDGIQDFVWFRSSDGQVATWQNATDGTYTPAFPASVGIGTWRPYPVGDLDGDGKDDIFWRDTATGMTAVWYMGAGAISGFDFFVSVPYQTWNLGRSVDMNLDGRFDLLWHGPANGDVVRWLFQGRGAAPVIEFLPGVGPGWQTVR